MLPALQTIQEKLASEHYDMLILDEILISVRDQYLDEQLLLDFIQSKPAGMELVMTGRAATEKVMELTDYVTFCKKLKHPYDRKIRSRKGVEY